MDLDPLERFSLVIILIKECMSLELSAAHVSVNGSFFWQ